VPPLEAGIVAALALAVGVGLSLGLVGGGGSILMVPILVYAARLPPHHAVALSLPVVGATAGIGAALRWQAGEVRLREGLLFAAAGIAGAPLGALLTPLLPGPTLLALFALLLGTVGIGMWREGKPGEPAVSAASCRPAVCLSIGFAVGCLTGFLGVGGGFLIVPALLQFARLPVRDAMGTSLLVIAVNAAVGFLAHAGAAVAYGSLAAGLTLAAIGGLVAGGRLARRFDAGGLRRAFAVLAVAVAAFMLATSLSGIMFPDAQGRSPALDPQ
jgi:hypothetical protein